MALPKLNESIKYELTLPSTGETVHFRPYLVKEEKVLMQALETGGPLDHINAVLNTLSACIDEPLNLKELATFDLDYMFLKLRAKSVGEIVNLNFKCNNEECNQANGPIAINLEEVEMANLENANKVVEISDGVSIEMKSPSYKQLSKLNIDDEHTADTTENIFKMITSSIFAIVTQEERILASDCTEKELDEFIESMNSAQFKKISEFLESMPELSKTVEFKCVSCKKHNKQVIKGLQSFFA